MNVNRMNAPSSGVRVAMSAPKGPPTLHVEEEEEEAPAKETPAAAPKAAEMKPENEEDEEIRLAMEMAMAASQNPNLSPHDLRKLVGEKNKQFAIVDKVQQEKEQKVIEEKQEAQRQWQEKKDNAFNWWKGKTEEFKTGAERRAGDLKVVASQKAEEFKDRAERRMYREEIRQDPEIAELKKKIKVLQKTFKAHRLQGNRVETRHVFKRQRQERKLIQTVEKLDKTKIAMTSSTMNIHEYAKALMRASKRWKKKGTDAELALEAQLCRNMHQMLTIEKQSAKVKKSTKEIKKYLQRCKGWLSDKKAFCEMHSLTLDATTNSTKLMYEETIMKQDALIAKLLELEEFKDMDIKAAASEVHVRVDVTAGTSKPLNALRGLPIMDSIRIKKSELKKLEAQLDPTPTMMHHSHAPQKLVANFDVGDTVTKETEPTKPEAAPVAPRAQSNKRDLIVEANTDDISVSSHLSDPDEPDEERISSKTDELSESDSENFGDNAPWAASTGGSASSSLDVVEEHSTPLGLMPPSEAPVIHEEAHDEGDEVEPTTEEEDEPNEEEPSVVVEAKVEEAVPVAVKEEILVGDSPAAETEEVETDQVDTAPEPSVKAQDIDESETDDASASPVESQDTCEIKDIPSVCAQEADESAGAASADAQDVDSEHAASVHDQDIDESEGAESVDGPQLDESKVQDADVAETEAAASDIAQDVDNLEGAASVENQEADGSEHAASVHDQDIDESEGTAAVEDQKLEENGAQDVDESEDIASVGAQEVDQSEGAASVEIKEVEQSEHASSVHDQDIDESEGADSVEAGEVESEHAASVHEQDIDESEGAASVEDQQREESERAMSDAGDEIDESGDHGAFDVPAEESHHESVGDDIDEDDGLDEEDDTGFDQDDIDEDDGLSEEGSYTSAS